MWLIDKLKAGFRRWWMDPEEREEHALGLENYPWFSVYNIYGGTTFPPTFTYVSGGILFEQPSESGKHPRLIFGREPAMITYDGGSPLGGMHHIHIRAQNRDKALEILNNYSKVIKTYLNVWFPKGLSERDIEEENNNNNLYIAEKNLIFYDK